MRLGPLLFLLLAVSACRGKHKPPGTITATLKDDASKLGTAVVNVEYPASTTKRVYVIGRRGADRYEIASASLESGKASFEVPLEKADPRDGGNYYIDVWFSTEKDPAQFATTGDTERQGVVLNVPTTVMTKAGASVVRGRDCEINHNITDERPALMVGHGCKLDHVMVNGTKLTENVNYQTEVPCELLVDGTQMAEALKTSPFSIVLPYPEPLTIKATGDFTLCVAKILTKVEQGPVKLAKEQPAPKRDRAIVIRHNTFDRYSPEVTSLGAGPLSGVGLVVIDRAKDNKKDCHYAEGYVAVRHEITSFVTIYDRTTGETVAKKTFAPPKGSCDETLLVNTKTGDGHTEGKGDTFTRASYDDVVAWAKTQLAK